MRSSIVFTLTGTDRVGIVEDVTGALLGLGANVETSRMARLGGEFAILMLVTLPQEGLDGLDAAFSGLTAEGYKITTTPTTAGEKTQPGWQTFRISVQGADHEGIVHEIAQGLSQRGINIESMETGVQMAPVSGAPLFRMSGVVVVPPAVAETDWIDRLMAAGDDANVDIEVTPAD